VGKLAHAESFRDLIVYQKARRLAQEVFVMTKAFPKEEMYSSTDQIRRASRSIGAQIAEVWAKRRYDRYFVSKLTDADGEQQETQHWLDTAVDCQYLSHNQAAPFIEMCAEIGRLLGGMISKANLFCGEPTKTLREPSTEYFANSPDTDH
jgi:four helix bundle protein